MRRPHAWTLALALSTLATPLAAQRLYKVELGAGGGFFGYNSKLQLKSGFGGAVRAGYWFHTPFSVEAQATFASPKTDTPLKKTVNASTVSLAVLDNFRSGPNNTLFAKLGYGRMSFGSCPTVSQPGSGPCGGANMLLFGGGIRLAVRQTLLMRYELEMTRSLGSLKFSNVALHGGATIMLGSKPLVDSDGDGVFDRYDRCPDTRLGALVDKHGCPADQDGDGVPDGLDRCPNTAAGATVDAAGCPTDSDGDGVLDGLDQCPDTPKGALVDSNGCPSDSDGDGVFDGLDRCPMTPVGATVDPLGCPGDADGDGVLDGLDKCPDTPIGDRVDENGCTLAVQQLAPEDTLAAELRWTLPGTVWQFRGAILGAAAGPVLDSVVSALKLSPTSVAEVNGYAQDRLVSADNTRLSKRRAEVVRDYLVHRGIEVSRITVFGKGSSSLIVTDTTEAARVINRRVEIRVTRNP